MTQITQILKQIEEGNPDAASDLLPLVYDELRRLAGRKMKNEATGQTLQPTALVHEAYMRLVGNEDSQEWENRAHFVAAAAEAMRRILIENARRRMSLKRGGNRNKFEIRDDDAILDSDHVDELLDLDAALTKLAETEPDVAKIVELRFFRWAYCGRIGESTWIIGKNSQT